MPSASTPPDEYDAVWGALVSPEDRHEIRYEGWIEAATDKGYVRRFDNQRNQWVTLPLTDIPDAVVSHRRQLDRTRRGVE